MKNYYYLFLGILFIGCTEKMVEFKPVEKKGDSYVVMDASTDPLFVKGLEKVFGFYEVKYEKTQESKIWIDAKLSTDLDLMYNYTKKARDHEWLKTH